VATRQTLGPQFAAGVEEAPLKYVSTEEIGNMRSANTEGRTSVSEWADALPESDRRASRVRGFISREGDIPGFLCVTPDRSMLTDGHHRYKEARDAGIPYMRVLDNPDDPRFKTPN
jgi:hypothetical protein